MLNEKSYININITDGMLANSGAISSTHKWHVNLKPSNMHKLKIKHVLVPILEVVMDGEIVGTFYRTIMR